MELRYKGTAVHYDAYCTLADGATTEGVVGMPEAHKTMLLESFPEEFEVVESGGVEEKKEPVVEELVIETPEDSFVIETPEAKMDKPRKK